LTIDVVRSFQRNGLANFASANAFLVGIQLDANVRERA
jgi:hypothetical protein